MAFDTGGESAAEIKEQVKRGTGADFEAKSTQRLDVIARLIEESRAGDKELWAARSALEVVTGSERSKLKKEYFAILRPRLEKEGLSSSEFNLTISAENRKLDIELSQANAAEMRRLKGVNIEGYINSLLDEHFRDASAVQRTTIKLASASAAGVVVFATGGGALLAAGAAGLIALRPAMVRWFRKNAVDNNDVGRWIDQHVVSNVAGFFGDQLLKAKDAVMERLSRGKSHEVRAEENFMKAYDAVTEALADSTKSPDKALANLEHRLRDLPEDARETGRAMAQEAFKTIMYSAALGAGISVAGQAIGSVLGVPEAHAQSVVAAPVENVNLAEFNALNVETRLHVDFPDTDAPTTALEKPFAAFAAQVRALVVSTHAGVGIVDANIPAVPANEAGMEAWVAQVQALVEAHIASHTFNAGQLGEINFAAHGVSFEGGELPATATAAQVQALVQAEIRADYAAHGLGNFTVPALPNPETGDLQTPAQMNAWLADVQEQARAAVARHIVETTMNTPFQETVEGGDSFNRFVGHALERMRVGYTAVPSGMRPENIDELLRHGRDAIGRACGALQDMPGRPGETGSITMYRGDVMTISDVSVNATGEITMSIAIDRGEEGMRMLALRYADYVAAHGGTGAGADFNPATGTGFDLNHTVTIGPDGKEIVADQRLIMDARGFGSDMIDNDAARAQINAQIVRLEAQAAQPGAPADLADRIAALRVRVGALAEIDNTRAADVAAFASPLLRDGLSPMATVDGSFTAAQVTELTARLNAAGLTQASFAPTGGGAAVVFGGGSGEWGGFSDAISGNYGTITFGEGATATTLRISEAEALSQTNVSSDVFWDGTTQASFEAGLRSADAAPGLYRQDLGTGATAVAGQEFIVYGNERILTSPTPAVFELRAATGPNMLLVTGPTSIGGEAVNLDGLRAEIAKSAAEGSYIAWYNAEGILVRAQVGAGGVLGSPANVEPGMLSGATENNLGNSLVGPSTNFNVARITGMFAEQADGDRVNWATIRPRT